MEGRSGKVKMIRDAGMIWGYAPLVGTLGIINAGWKIDKTRHICAQVLNPVNYEGWNAQQCLPLLTKVQYIELKVGRAVGSQIEKNHAEMTHCKRKPIILKFMEYPGPDRFWCSVNLVNMDDWLNCVIART